jgi:hypothetical protein
MAFVYSSTLSLGAEAALQSRLIFKVAGVTCGLFKVFGSQGRIGPIINYSARDEVWFWPTADTAVKVCMLEKPRVFCR